MHHACRGLLLAGLKTLEISYWNSYVGVGQMGGHGTFIDPRIGLVIRQTPIASRHSLTSSSRISSASKRRSLRAAASIDRPPIAEGACSATRQGARHVIRGRC